MSDAKKRNNIRRAAALVLALLLSLSPLATLAMAPQNSVDITLNWTSDDGTPMSSIATPLLFPEYPDSYWLYAEEQVFNKDAVLRVLDNFSQYPGGFEPNNQSLSTLVVPDAGISPAADTFIEIHALDASNNVAATFRLFISRQTPQPIPPETEPVLIPASVITIHYQDMDGNEVAPSQTKTLEAGTHSILPEPDILNPVYVPYDIAPRTVMVDANGANPTDITFIYQYVPPAIQATVTVFYVGPNNETVASPQQKIFDQAGVYDIPASPEDLMAGYTITGSVSKQVSIDQNGANPSEIIFNYSAPPALEADILIRYINEQGGQVATSQQVSYIAGSYEVTAQPYNLEQGYELIDTSPQIVSVNEQGAANPAEITFVYRLALAPSVDISVRFVDVDGQPIAPDRIQTVNDGTNAINADFLEGYTLQGEETQYVTVTMQGAQPSTVIFTYMALAEQTPEIPEPTAPPAPKVSFIPVIYKDQANNVFFETKAKVVEGEETIIAVDLTQVDQEQYELNDITQKTATLDAEGNLSPLEIVFLFNLKMQQVAAKLTVYYLDESGNEVARPEEVTLTQIGFNDVNPNPKNLLPGYEIVTGQKKQAVVGADSAVNPSQIEFFYQKIPSEQTAAPIATTYPVIPLENVYIHPHKDNINIRSAPKIEESNILGVVNEKDIGLALGYSLDEKNEQWYLTQIGGFQGYIKETVADMLTQEQVNAHLGLTPAPAPVTQVPTSTPQPEGMLIGRWGETNVGQLHFRKDPNDKSSTNIISKLDKGVKLWVYAQEIVGSENELWFEVMISDKIGYLKAQFVMLYDQDQSDSYQTTLGSPVPQRQTPTINPDEITPIPSPVITESPTVSPTQTPAALTASPIPQSYLGYALTIAQVALRTGANVQDESILATLPTGTLLRALAQTYLPDGTIWHHMDVLNGSNQSGFVPESSIRRISPTEAETYMNSAQPATAVPTRVPDRVSGYAITLGRDVLMREYADTNAKISRVLPEDTIVMVTSQEYVLGVGWHLVQYNGLYGFIRADQLRMLTFQESRNYLESLKQTPLPPKATLSPLSTDSLSSYGYINADKVRLRKDANSNASTIKFMDRNAFALVIDTVNAADGSQWYRINQNGTEGYVMGRYLSVLKLGELQQYLSSKDFQNGNNPISGSQGGTTNITPLEDYNKVVWKNPNIQASYEPFNPIATPTPPVEAILSPSVSPIGGDFVVEASSSLDPLVTFEPFGTQAPTAPTSRFPTGWLAIGIIGVLGGGGYYAYRMYRDNQRKAAQRAAQRRQQAVQGTGRTPGSGQTPSTRPAGSQTGQSGSTVRPGQSPMGGQPYSPYAPPGNNQGTTAYKPAQPGQVPPPGGQGTASYKPVQPGQVPPPLSGQGTATYRPLQPGQIPPPASSPDTMPFRPNSQGQVPPPLNTQGTAPYVPFPPGQIPPASNLGTATYKPAQTGQAPKTVAQDGTAKQISQPPLDKTGQSNDTLPQTDTHNNTERKRRADRHSDSDKV